jgi:hypothetical protein
MGAGRIESDRRPTRLQVCNTNMRLGAIVLLSYFPRELSRRFHCTLALIAIKSNCAELLIQYLQC